MERLLEVAATLPPGTVSRTSTVTLQPATVLRKKELSRGLCLLTISHDERLLTAVVKTEEVGRSAREATAEAGVGAEVIITGHPENSSRGVPGVLCLQLDVTPGKGCASKKTGAGNLTGAERSECRLGTSCMQQDSCPFRHSKDVVKTDDLLTSKKARFEVVGEFVLGQVDVGDGPVLDVAGGKGYLSLHIAKKTENRAKCVVIDPANTARGVSHRAKVKEAGIERVTLTTTSPDLPTALTSTCTCIIGVHPDEATDDIVILGLKHNKPFFVVPCCVFPSKFTHRQLPCGAPVTTREELITYLSSLCIAAGRTPSTATLPFQGANTILYCL